MSALQNDPFRRLETTCGNLLNELKIIWDEVGESDADRERMLLELEQECMDLYRRKVDIANRGRAQLCQAIADAEAELATICSAMGERPVHIRQTDGPTGSLKQVLHKLLPQLEEMQKRRNDRKNQFLEVLQQIHKLSDEINGSVESNPFKINVDEGDLSLRKLEELHRQLHSLQKERSDRMKQIHDLLKLLNSLCNVLGLDLKNAANEVHPSLGDLEGSMNISNETIKRLANAIENLREVKLQRMQKLQDLASSMLELWHLMDTPVEEQQMFQNVTCNIAAMEHEITEPNMLSVDYIKYVEAEVDRLEELKASKMRELVLKKKLELEEICRKTHLVPEADTAMDIAIDAIECGSIDAVCVLEQIELQIAKVKEEAFSRKEILDRVEKWLAACEEESWLEEYNRDENRYNAGRGTHLNLKRAEKARNLVTKLPAMVEALTSKTMAWENEKGYNFSYDGVRLLSMLEDYIILRQEKEAERRRQRDQKKLQGLLIAEQEVRYGSKPSPSKPQSAKKASKGSSGGAQNKRVSVGGSMLQTPKPDTKTQSRPSSRKSDCVFQNDDQQDDSFSNYSGGIHSRKYSLGIAAPHEAESSMARKPFSPIASKANIENLFNDPNNTHGEALHKATSENSTAITTPIKCINVLDEENRTPKAMSIPLSATPSKDIVPMQTTLTPAFTPAQFANSLVEVTPGDIEYSFEERRVAALLVPKPDMKSTIQF